MSMEEYNRKAALANFPPDKRWAKIEGVLIQPRSNPALPPLVSIAGRDHKGAEIAFWTDLPNAMYLMNMLSQLRSQHNSSVPSKPPTECAPFETDSGAVPTTSQWAAWDYPINSRRDRSTR